jgi:death-on-curing protein
LTAAEVLLLHARLIQRTGGSRGVLGVPRLESALARPQATFGGEDLYPDVWSVAAALLHSLIGNHPFVDGNKRTAFAATGIFLELNGHVLAASNDDAVGFVRRVIVERLDVQEIASWLRTHSDEAFDRR